MKPIKLKLRKKPDGRWSVNSSAHNYFNTEDTFDSVKESIPKYLRSEYRNNWTAIRNHYRNYYSQRRKKIHSYYNIRWESQNVDQNWDEILMEIFNRQTSRFKINFSHSFILYNKEMDRLRFYHASNNVGRVLQFPKTINDIHDFSEFKKQINHQDMLLYAKQYRPDSKWTVLVICSTTFFIDTISDHPIGKPTNKLPDFLCKKGIISFLTNLKTGKKFNDDLCFYRCLAAFLGTPKQALERKAKNLKKKLQYDSITLKDIPQLENRLNINIDVFKPDMKNKCLSPELRTNNKFEHTMRIICHKNHFMLITDISRATSSFSCGLCGKIWKKNSNYQRHKQICSGNPTKYCYPGGVFYPYETIPDQLRSAGIHFPENFIYPFRIVYDFEAYQHPIYRKTEKTVYTTEHIPLSVSVCSNVPGYKKPICFITQGNSQYLIDQMGNYMEEIQGKVSELLTDQLRDVYTEIKEKDVDTDVLLKKLDIFLNQVPVLGFNSGKYDINLVKVFFIKRFVLNHEKAYVTKRNNDFIAVSNEKFLFLDIKNFLAPGFSYSTYLSAYKVKETKGFFPYEYIKDWTQLEETKLPPKEAFYSSLKNEAISTENYEFCQRVWQENNMKTMKDFLIWYNNKDVEPFIEALEVQTKFYKEKLNLDMLKQGKSIPGLTLRYIFKTLPNDVYFSLINEKHKDLHTLLRNELVGGPSIVFRRYHERDVTFIRNDTKIVKRVLGYDANALYLWALMQNHPTEHPIRRRKENSFRAEKMEKYGSLSREWLEWMAFTQGVFIRHKFNGKEQRLGQRKIPVDGYIESFRGSKAICFQFHGCAFHGCPKKCKNVKHLKTHPYKKNISQQDLYMQTQNITKYLKEEVNVQVIEMWECTWFEMKQNSPQIQAFLEDNNITPKSVFDGIKDLNESIIIEKIVNGQLFGLIQCDIEVPQELREYFKELPPVFKNTKVSVDDIGEHMKTFCKENKILSQPRRTLISSFFGKSILLITPLIQWYIKHGLIVSNIQQIVEYRPQTCFKKFGETVTAGRLEGDKNPDSSILADTMKLLGNSAYGKTLENLALHRQNKYTQDSSKLVNNCLFHSQRPIDQDLIEVEMNNKTVKWGLPLQIGFFVYQYAKLKMLSFYFDCLLHFIDEKDFELCEMDTDSFYFAISSESLEDVIKENKKKEFYENFHNWFPAQTCDLHRPEYIKKKLSGQTWNPIQSCCQARKARDKRTPGLMKTEWIGDGCIALSSKTYYCFLNNKDGGECNIKIASKGLNKRQNNLTKKMYLDVIKTKITGKGTNIGFRTNGKKIFGYKQERASLPYLYIKRKVKDDGITTEALQL